MKMNFKKTAFDLKQKLRPGVVSQYKTLLDNQFLSSDELEELNWKKRNIILHHAYEKVPFYNQLYKAAGLHPNDIRTTEDWANLPIISKEIIRNNFEELISVEAERKALKLVTTGGSTGEPLKLYQDKSYPIETIGWRLLSWWGVNPFDDAAYCWRLIRKDWRSKTLNSLMWYPTRRIWLDASKMSEDYVVKFISKFNTLKPIFFHGYTGSVDFVAQYVLNNNITIHSPKCIWGTSSPISGTQRANIEKAFRAPLYDQYGCSEVYWLAGECRKKRGLHFFSDVRHIEFTDKNGDTLPLGKTGDIVITDLVNFGFPLIRYRNGDRSSFMIKKCDCGINLPLIEPIKGRITDLVRTPDGGAIGGDYITTLFDDFPDAVRAFQLRQAADYSIIIYVVPGLNISDTSEAIANVKTVLEDSTGRKVDISFEYVEKIESDRGKTRFVISDIN